MSDLLRQRQTARRIGQTEVIEKPGVSGSWTPEFSGSTTSGIFTYTLQVGTWTRLYDRLVVDGHVGISAISGVTPPVGNMRIKGLPFAAITLTNYVAGCDWSVITNFNYKN